MHSMLSAMPSCIVAIRHLALGHLSSAACQASPSFNTTVVYTYVLNLWCIANVGGCIELYRTAWVTTEIEIG